MTAVGSFLAQVVGVVLIGLPALLVFLILVAAEDVAAWLRRHRRR